MSRIRLISILAIIVFVFLAGCGSEETTLPPTPTLIPVIQSTEVPAATSNPTSAPPTVVQGEAEEVVFMLTSTAFEHEAPIPTIYSCDGENISPPLTWSNPPDGSVSFALINDDPDAPAGIWVHWVLFNIPVEVTGLAEAIPAQVELEDGSLHGENSWGRADYGGPCPPGGTHRYFFKLYALDTALDLDDAPTKEELLEAMDGHILGEAELMGTYAR
jgi:Raf kinase inhibitor-like YbhB/YbcL family protein